MNLFEKPYCGSKEKPCYPYSKDLFREADLFHIIILDGGAYFFYNEKFSEPPTGENMLNRIMNGELMSLWTGEKGFQWDFPLRLHGVGDKYEDTQWEWVVWINRFYFLPPIAQKYSVTGDEKYAQLWHEYLSDWIDKNPYRKSEDLSTHTTDNIIWRDMQVCWRLMNLIHSIYLLSGSTSLSRENWAEIYKFIELHAEQTYKEVEYKFTFNNHFAHKGLALIYAGALFPEFENSKKYIDMGKRVLAHHMKNEICDDGGSIEASPSYGHFVARIYLEAYLLLKYNGYSEIDGFYESIIKQYNWLYNMATPTLRSLQVNASYSFDAQSDFKIVSKLLSIDLFGERKSTLFPDSNFAVLRNKTFDIYIDSMKQRPYYLHMGRPQILIYKNGLPLISDAGVVNYDNKLNREYLKRAAAHNVIVFPEIESLFEEPREMIDFLVKNSDNKIIDFNADARGGSVTAVCSITHNGLEILWTRKIVLDGENIEISDKVRSNRAVECRQVFHFASPQITLQDNDTAAVIGTEEQAASISQSEISRKFRLKYGYGVTGNDSLVSLPILTTEQQGESCDFKVLIQ